MKNKYFWYFVILLFAFNTSLSQDIINPYLQYTSPGSNIFPEYIENFQGGNPSLNYNFEHPMVFGDISTYKSPNNLYYLGEYELCVR
ncbi:MAG TPA: hypothetical protein PKC92_12515, partial [Bacteroidia bacterium]|nr:hypothetical protein [Bacteroidia bacterium]